jgi:threonine dehydratase
LCAGQLVFCDPTLASRHATCAEVQQRTGATFIPPYDYGPVMAGQGTIALEFLQQVGGCVVVFLLRGRLSVIF